MAAGVPKPITGRILPDTRPGKRLRNELENHHAMKIGKSTISTGPFSIANCKSQPEAKSHLEITRILLVYPMKNHHFSWLNHH